jgi:transcriptional regulator with XRE-family HTH domain
VDFGGFVAEMREKNGLSLRELERRADDLSHVYIWRLERGERSAPSDETVERLVIALALSQREKEILLLLRRTDIHDELYKLILAHPELPISHVEPVATMSFRGNRPTDKDGWLRTINWVQENFGDSSE